MLYMIQMGPYVCVCVCESAFMCASAQVIQLGLTPIVNALACFN